MSLSLTSTHTTQTTGTLLGTTTPIIQALGTTGAITTLGTTEDTAGVTATIHGTTTAGTADGTEGSTGDGTEGSTTHGTTAHGILDSMTHTTITCTHTTVDGMADGVRTLEESTTGHIMAEDTLSSKVKISTEGIARTPLQAERQPA